MNLIMTLRRFKRRDVTTECCKFQHVSGEWIVIQPESCTIPFYGDAMDIPSGYVKIAIENGHTSGNLT